MGYAAGVLLCGHLSVLGFDLETPYAFAMDSQVDGNKREMIKSIYSNTPKITKSTFSTQGQCSRQFELVIHFLFSKLGKSFTDKQWPVLDTKQLRVFKLSAFKELECLKRQDDYFREIPFVIRKSMFDTPGGDALETLLLSITSFLLYKQLRIPLGAVKTLDSPQQEIYSTEDGNDCVDEDILEKKRILEKKEQCFKDIGNKIQGIKDRISNVYSGDSLEELSQNISMRVQHTKDALEGTLVFSEHALSRQKKALERLPKDLLVQTEVHVSRLLETFGSAMDPKTAMEQNYLDAICMLDEISASIERITEKLDGNIDISKVDEIRKYIWQPICKVGSEQQVIDTNALFFNTQEVEVGEGML